MPRPLTSSYEQLTVPVPVQSATASAPTPSGATWYSRRASLTSPGARTVMLNATPRG